MAGRIQPRHGARDWTLFTRACRSPEDLAKWQVDDGHMLRNRQISTTATPGSTAGLQWRYADALQGDQHLRAPTPWCADEPRRDQCADLSVISDSAKSLPNPPGGHTTARARDDWTATCLYQTSDRILKLNNLCWLSLSAHPASGRAA